MIYAIADLHFGHENIIKYCNRPFLSVEAMDAALIDNWNKTVGVEDDIYILGDLTVQRGEAVERLLEQLHGRKYLVRGNHDYFANDYHGTQLQWIKDYYEMDIGKKQFVLCHYPFVEWNGQKHGAYHLHGHQHNRPDYNLRQKKESLRRYDVGVDANGFTPVRIDNLAD